jgi:hypothetical protein
VHRVQGEAEGVKPIELLELLQECYRQRLDMVLRHRAVARQVGNFDFNNTYQYVVAREDTHLEWLRSAIEDLGGVPAATGSEPAIPAGEVASLIREDAAAAGRFVETWRPKIAAINNARHRLMLNFTLGETLEHKRFFEQAVAGREDLLGRRLDAGPRRGAVMGSRWVGD